MDNFFDEIVSVLLVLLLMTTTKDEDATKEEKLEEKLDESIPEPALQVEPVSYIFKSSNRKRLRPKVVYF